MAKKVSAHCADCMPTIKDFPSLCVPEVLAFVSGDTTDLAHKVHCAQTLQWWAFSIWVDSEDPHPLIGVGASAGGVDAAKAELEKVQAAVDGTKVKGAASAAAIDWSTFNWQLIVTEVFMLILKLWPKK